MRPVRYTERHQVMVLYREGILRESMTSYDLVIVGAGPGGLTAGIYARSKMMKTLIIDAHKVGGQLVSLYPEKGIHNYPGYETIQARKLSDKLYAQAESMECDIHEGEKVQDIVSGDEEYIIKTDKGEYTTKSVIVAIGMGMFKPKRMGVPGEAELEGKGLTYILPVKEELVAKKVVMFGGGNSAMDAARCAMRLQPETVTIAYRRSREEMPARAAEVEHAQEEGIQFEYLVTPKEILQDEQGRVTGIRFTRNQLGEPDERGRRRPVEIPGSDFVQPADTVITAIGQRPNPTIAKTTPALKTTERGVIALNEKGETSMPGVYAGGDIIRGGATVLLAMNDGIAAAGRINEYLKGK